MKGRVNSTVWSLIAINAVVLLTVLLLAYAAGARSGGLSLIDFGALPMIAGFEFLGAVFLVLAGSLISLLVLASRILKPLSHMVEFSEKLAAGEYSVRADITPDDFGAAAENFNHAAELLEKISQIEAADKAFRAELAELETAIAFAARGDFTARVRASQPPLPAAEAFNNMVEGMARRLDRVRASAAEITGNVSQVLVTSSEIASGAAQQEQDSGGAAGAIEELTGATKQVAAHAQSGMEAARRASEFAEQGKSFVRDAAEGMQRIRGSMQATAEKIKSLGARSLEIYEIINIIHETNLLALNAVVESSRGGQGQTLDVLATEMRKLAEHSRGATRDIVALLKAIQAESNEAVVVMEQGNRVAEAGARLTEQASRAFAGISQLLRQSADFAQAIGAASRQQVQGTERVAGSILKITGGIRQNSARARQVGKIAEQMLHSSEQLTQAVGQLRSAGPTVVKAEKAEVMAAGVARA
jgi:methyl-accepting chemotaxis protein